MENKGPRRRNYHYPSKGVIVGKRAMNIKSSVDDEEGTMMLGSKKKFISGMGQLAAIVKYFFSNAGLVYGCIIFASIGEQISLSEAENSLIY